MELARSFWKEAVFPVIQRQDPGLRLSAGLIGWSSEVIGCDDAFSQDHWWGPRCQVWLRSGDFEKRYVLGEALRESLPLTYRGYPTHMPEGRLTASENHPISHQVHFFDAGDYFASLTGSPVGQWTPVQWLTIHEHQLLGVTSGELFRDDLGLQELRNSLSFYPEDIRLHLIAVEWGKICQEQAFPARSGVRGAEVGAALVAARMAESLMRLCFYLARRYPPYSKWFGVKFLELPGGPALDESLSGMLRAQDWESRDKFWCAALAGVLRLHEEQGFLPSGKYQIAPIYEGRPGMGLPIVRVDGRPTIGDLVDEIRTQIKDPVVLKLPKEIGSINQISSSTDITDNRMRSRKLGILYEE